MPECCIEACVTDPPYGLSREPDIAEVLTHWLAGDDYKAATGGGFMGKSWDSFVPGPATWREVFRVLKPGAYLLCFAGTRTQDLMGIALRLAGFEIRDCIRYEQGREAWPGWIFGVGFPKSLNVSKAIDKMAGMEREVVGPGTRHNSKRCAMAHGDTERLAGGVPPITAPATPEAAQWNGWGTALKPAHEPILIARKPINGTVAQNVMAFGCGGLNIDACRVQYGSESDRDEKLKWSNLYGGKGYADNNLVLGSGLGNCGKMSTKGRFPANVIHDGSEEGLAAFAAFGEKPTGNLDRSKINAQNKIFGTRPKEMHGLHAGDSGTASRFFYSSKANTKDRCGSKHPTIKPVSLIEYLVRLVTPPNGTVLDPFAGSGTLATAAHRVGVRAILIEREEEYIADIQRRVASFDDAKPSPVDPQLSLLDLAAAD